MRDFEDGAGVYCFFSFDNRTKAKKFVCKIGMTTSFHNRIGGYHTYFPMGVWYLAFLKTPTRRNHFTTLRQYYECIEKEIYDDIVAHGGRPVINPTRTKNNGITEWILTDEVTIDTCFTAANNKYGGDLTLGSLANFNRQQAAIKAKGVYYTGQIIFV